MHLLQDQREAPPERQRRTVMGDRKGQKCGSRKALEVWTGEKNSRGGRLELLADSQVDLGTLQRPLPFWFRALTT